jgi:Helix-hairpin-helix domain
MQSRQFRPIRKPAWKVRLKAAGRGVKWERVIALIECHEMGAPGVKPIPKANGMAFAPHLIMTATINTEIAARLKEIARLLDEQEAKQFRVTAYRRAAETLKNLKRLLQFSARRRMMIWPINQ